jgi:AcrR family transcriptional regulator
MIENNPQHVGRPRRSSKRTLEEAAAELFLEQTYAGTTVDQIAARAGVSRNTFFNYFASKADVLWVDFDETIERLADELAAAEDGSVMDAVRDAIVRVAASHPDDRVPWALTQVDLMGTRDELEASGLQRFMRQAAALRAFLAGRVGEAAGPLHPQAVAFAVLGAAAAAAGVWANAGVGRRPLAEYVDEAVSPVCAGFAAAS